MKRCRLLIITILTMILFSGCSSDPKKEEEIPATSIPTPEEICGIYTDETAGRAMIEVDRSRISGSWSSSYNQITLFDLPTDYDASSNMIRYAEGVITERTYTNEKEYTDTEKYNDATGCFEIQDKKLIWHDEKQDSEVVLVKVDPVFYRRCESLQEALDVSGINFAEPADDLYPMEIENKTYFAAEGLIMIMCENKTQTINIAKASNQEAIAKVFDVSAFSKTWVEYIKGVQVNCFGNSEKIEMATFDNGTDYYGISCFDVSPQALDTGLSIEELQSLIMGMQ
ncbi:MAG: hypothetical protein IIZ80_10100 [Erysipelotrichaceae bacterium]|nr:hypothetical protein [Erysipelotrichaceae bacterium]